jgi:haloalkane dehalogenase
VDEGPPDAEIVLCIHGEPSWAFLYRKMIPVFAEAGFRAVAPDLVGFGRSDKPSRREDYTYQRHVDWTKAWLEALDLRRITLVCQDWGGLIGLRLAAEHPERFSRLVVANTGLPAGGGAPGEAFMNWRRFSQEIPTMPIGQLINGSCGGELPADVIAAYDAPFPDEDYKEGARIFPVLVPISDDDPAIPANRRAWEVFERWQKPVLTAFSDGDPITRGGEQVFQERIPGAKGQPHTTIEGAGHFLQEMRGGELARVVVDFMRATPV